MSVHRNGVTTNGTPSQPPTTEVTPAKAKRRSFTVQQKLQILAEVERLPKGEIGAYLRRKGIYSSSLSDWKKLRDEGLLTSKTAPQRGPAPKSMDAKEIERLQRENAKLRLKLDQADKIISAQKKLCEIYTQDTPAKDDAR
jgi:transposase